MKQQAIGVYAISHIYYWVSEYWTCMFGVAGRQLTSSRITLIQGHLSKFFPLLLYCMRIQRYWQADTVIRNGTHNNINTLNRVALLCLASKTSCDSLSLSENWFSFFKYHLFCFGHSNTASGLQMKAATNGMTQSITNRDRFAAYFRTLVQTIFG